MSTPISELLEEHFNDLVLPPPKSGSKDDDAGGGANNAGKDMNDKSQTRRGLALVYVSSDRSEEEMKSYVENRNWFTVPYESNERSGLKTHFKTCAKVEMEQLGFERRHEIPTLIVVDGASHNVLTFTGVKDVKEHGVKALETWHKLQTLSAALDAKFAHTDDAGVDVAR